MSLCYDPVVVGGGGVHFSKNVKVCVKVKLYGKYSPESLQTWSAELLYQIQQIEIIDIPSLNMIF